MLNVRFREKTSAWPGFVDLFSNLVIILIFLLIVFVFLWTTTSVFNKNTGARKIASLERQSQQQAEQIVQMTADKEEAEQLLLAARSALENQEAQIVNKQRQQENLANAYEQQIAVLTAQQNELYNEVAQLRQMLNGAAATETAVAEVENEYIATQQELVAQIEQLNAQIAQLQSALDAAEEAAKQQDIEYIEMSNRLNKALADKVAELSALGQYQSEFYKQIKLALGDGATSIKQDGDRFIVSSDILFPSGSYKISSDGQKQLKLLANVIKNLERKIPDDIDWIIRVDGHTDNKPVIPGTAGYKNNMELSLLRSTAVVNELIKNGVSKRHLIPSGFGDLYPVAFGNNATSRQKNRRIELQLTNK